MVISFLPRNIDLRVTPLMVSMIFLRYLDDRAIFTRNSWMLRRVVRKWNGILSGLKPEKAEDQTFIGKIERGFDFPGNHFSPDGSSPAEKTAHNFAERLRVPCYASGEKSGLR